MPELFRADWVYKELRFVPDPLMVSDHLIDNEPQEFLTEFRIKIGITGELPQARNLFLFAGRISRRKVIFGFIFTNGLSYLEPFGEHENQRGIDIVDALAILLQLFIHARRLSPPEFRVAVGFARLVRGATGTALISLAMAIGTCHIRCNMSATVHPIRGEKTPSLEPIMALVASDMNAVNSVILDRMQSEIPLIPELAGHLIAGGGKRMRPMLTLAAAKLIGYSGDRHFKLAAAVEFIHTATLLHDDVVDGSDLRRGKTAANLIFGNPATVLVGDFLFSRSFELMVEDGSLKVLKILSNASAVIAEGEVHQLTAQRKIDTSEDRYLEIIGAKTAALFAAASRISAVVAESDEETELALDSYGRNLGIAFQLVDDAIDYSSDSETMGKDAGDDFRQGKVTLPVILAYARGNDEERQFWKDAIIGHKLSDEDLARATSLLRSTGAIDDTMSRARHYGQRAIDALGKFSSGKAKDAMTEAVEFAISRAY